MRHATFSSDVRSAPDRSFQTAEPSLFIADTSNVPGFVISDVLKEHGIVSLANVPILFGVPRGACSRSASSSARDFSQDTVEFMTAAAAVIGATVHSDTSQGGAGLWPWPKRQPRLSAKRYCFANFSTG